MIHWTYPSQSLRFTSRMTQSIFISSVQSPSYASRDLIPPCNRFLQIYNSYSTDALLPPCGSSIPVCSSPQSFATTREMPSNRIVNTIRYITTPHRPHHPSDNWIRLNDSSHTVCLSITRNKANIFSVSLIVFVRLICYDRKELCLIHSSTKRLCPSCLELLPRDTGKDV